MTCRDVIELLADYLDMACAPETVAALEAHLADCAPCQAYLRTYRRARELATASERAALPPAMPPEMKAHLRAFLRAHLLEGES
jgi:predicted anti-sigma-YlaC factor YlaD